MNAPAKTLTTWRDEPRHTGAAWIAVNTGRLLHNLWIALLTRFISVLGSLSAPGMKPACALQAWALRRMGVTCPGNDVWIGPHVYFDYPERLVFGRRVTIGPESRLTARSTIEIGDDFLAAPGLVLNTGTHDAATLVPQSSPITIGPGVWCGTRVTICAGVNVGGGSVVGAGSVVLKDVPAWHLAFGVPCRPQRALPERPAAGRWSNFRPTAGLVS
jgi:acetyltransferase-like isoleucine patch superfamily enzyme